MQIIHFVFGLIFLETTKLFSIILDDRGLLFGNFFISAHIVETDEVQSLEMPYFST